MMLLNLGIGNFSLHSQTKQSPSPTWCFGKICFSLFERLLCVLSLLGEPTLDDWFYAFCNRWAKERLSQPINRHKNRKKAKQMSCPAQLKNKLLIGNCWLFKLPLFFFIFFPSLSFPSFIPYSLLLLFISSQVFSARVPPTPTIIVTSCAPFYHSSSFVLLSLGPFSSIKALTLFIGAQHHHKLPFLNNFDEVSFQNRLKPTNWLFI